MAYIYMLRCEGDAYYTGITTDLARRMGEHCARRSVGAKYTRAHPPVALAAAWEIDDLGAAARVEYRIKRFSHAQKKALAEEPQALGAADFPLPEGLAPQALLQKDLPAFFNGENKKQAPMCREI